MSGYTRGMAVATISVRKAADIPRCAIDASSVSTHVSELPIYGDGAAHATLVIVPREGSDDGALSWPSR
jgi:hypothetical protein